jgi:hypothetical protein
LLRGRALSSLFDSVEVGVFVLGMHRSGTSAATRLINLLGVRTPREDDLVPASDKNPKGYWESMSLVAFNTRVLAAVGSNMSCPVALEPGWEDDPRLDGLRREAPEAVHQVFPTAPWVWKDPRNCLAFDFWRGALAVQPVVVLVTRNPLEIVASARRARSDQGKIYALALWERYLRQALGQVVGLPVLVTGYEKLLAAPLAWCERAHEFLTGAGVTAHAHRDSEVLAFVDTGLRNAEFSRAEFLDDSDVSDAQRALFLALEQLEGRHDEFSPPALPAETPTTEALLAERRRALQIKDDLSRSLEIERRSRRWSRVRSSRYTAPARRVYASVRRFVRA